MKNSEVKNIFQQYLFEQNKQILIHKLEKLFQNNFGKVNLCDVEKIAKSVDYNCGLLYNECDNVINIQLNPPLNVIKIDVEL